MILWRNRNYPCFIPVTLSYLKHCACNIHILSLNKTTNKTITTTTIPSDGDDNNNNNNNRQFLSLMLNNKALGKCNFEDQKVTFFFSFSVHDGNLI